MSTRKQALTGSAWTIFGYGATQVIRLGSNLVLAWMLFPAAFGVMALVTVVMQGLQMFSEVGIGPSIIQNRRGEEEAFLNTAWTIQVIRGFVLWIGACLLAWPAAWFFGQKDPLAEELVYMLPVVGFTSVLGGFNATAVFTLNRKMAIRQVILLELIPQFFSVTTMIVWAWLVPSVWALVSGWMAYSIVRLWLSHRLNRPMRHRFEWEPDAARELIHFGLWIFLGTIVAFLAGSLDRILLGKLLSLEMLGLYSIALTFARVGIEVSQRLSHTVLFPVLSRSQDDPPRLVAQSLHARSLILTAGGVVVGAFAVGAPLFFEVLYDPRYAEAGQYARWLSLSVWASIVLSSMERVPLALGHPRALFVANLITTGAYGLAVPAFYQFGLPGFIVALACGSFIAHGVLLIWIPVRRGEMALQTLGYSLVFGAYGGLAVWAMARFASPEEKGWAILQGVLWCLPLAAAGGWICWRRLKGGVR